MVGANAAGLYGFDLERAGSRGRPGRAARVRGPGRDRSTPGASPTEALRCPTFAGAVASRRRLTPRPICPTVRSVPPFRPERTTTMARVRYGARTADQLEDREVKATSVGAWSTSLTASYETDPDVVAAVLPPPLEPTDQPLVRVSVATVDLGEGPAALRCRDLRRAGPPRGHRGQLPAGHADDHRAVGDRRARDLRRAEEAGAGRAESATATASVRTCSRLGIPSSRSAGRVGRAGRPATRTRAHRLLLQVPARARRQRLRHRDPALVYCRRQETARSCDGWRERCCCTSRRSTRWPTCPCASWSSMTLVPSVAASRRGEIVSRVRRPSG